MLKKGRHHDGHDDRRTSSLNQTKQAIKAVTFDLWETLLFERDGDSERRTAARCLNLVKVLNRFGLKVTVEQLSSALQKTISSLLAIWDTNKDVTHMDQLRLIVKHASEGTVSLKEEWVDDLSSAYVSPIIDVPPYLNPNVREVLAWIKSRNMRIGLVCNTGLTPGSGLRKLLSNEGIIHYFDLLIYSDEVGIRKPDPEIFNLVAQKLSLKPYEIVHVGDNLKSDVCGAKNAGFKAIHLDSEEGRDRLAEADPSSLVVLSRNLGKLGMEQMAPDKTIASLTMVTKTIEELEKLASGATRN